MNKKEIYLVDPPYGWKYGFPKELPENYKNYTDNEFNEWLIQNGYPKEEIDSFKNQFTYRIIKKI